jgi:hypothetical protein
MNAENVSPTSGTGDTFRTQKLLNGWMEDMNQHNVLVFVSDQRHAVSLIQDLEHDDCGKTSFSDAKTDTRASSGQFCRFKIHAKFLSI